MNNRHYLLIPCLLLTGLYSCPTKASLRDCWGLCRRRRRHTRSVARQTPTPPPPVVIPTMPTFAPSTPPTPDDDHQQTSFGADNRRRVSEEIIVSTAGTGHTTPEAERPPVLQALQAIRSSTPTQTNVDPEQDEEESPVPEDSLVEIVVHEPTSGSVEEESECEEEEEYEEEYYDDTDSEEEEEEEVQPEAVISALSTFKAFPLNRTSTPNGLSDDDDEDDEEYETSQDSEKDRHQYGITERMRYLGDGLGELDCDEVLKDLDRIETARSGATVESTGGPGQIGAATTMMRSLAEVKATLAALEADQDEPLSPLDDSLDEEGVAGLIETYGEPERDDQKLSLQIGSGEPATITHRNATRMLAEARKLRGQLDDD